LPNVEDVFKERGGIAVLAQLDVGDGLVLLLAAEEGVEVVRVQQLHTRETVLGNRDYYKCCGSAFISSGSGSSIRLITDPDPGL
jgi:hypothetical protein